MPDTPQPEPRARQAWTSFMGGVGSVSALIGLGASLFAGITWYQNHRKHTETLRAQMALATAQAAQGEYQAAVQTDADILKGDPLFQPASDQQLANTMLWVENFSVTEPEGQSAEAVASPALDQIFSILDAALTRTKGVQAADVQAHLGWAHWLNQHIAEREFGPAAERDLRAALQTDPSNVYAHAMLGNWLLQNGGSLPEGVAHFDAAVATGKQRPLVRRFQIAAFLDDDAPGARAALFKAANDVRKAGEPLNDGDRHRVLGLCCDPAVNEHADLVESLSAVPPSDAGETYLWLDHRQRDGYEGSIQILSRAFTHALLLEIAGDRQQSLAAFRALQLQLAKHPGTLSTATNQAIARLSS